MLLSKPLKDVIEINISQREKLDIDIWKNWKDEISFQPFWVLILEKPNSIFEW